MTYAEAIQFLYDLRMFGANLGLDNTRKLAALAGNPHEHLRFIHVAGTNGKGSTCAMWESLNRTAGWRVGLFTTPHLVSFAERMQVNRQLISEGEAARLAEEIKSLILRGWGALPPPPNSPSPGGPQPTFFEAVTVMALRHFAEQKCDLVIWETGLGGRLDATNIVTPLASVITNIDFDHQQWLGSSLKEIAAEKAGIIKPGVPVITAATQPEALQVVAETAQNLDSLLTVIDWNDARGEFLKTLKLPLAGEHQRLNAAVAVATVRALGDRFPVPQETILAGLNTVEWPGRMQRVKTAAGQEVLLDGAHNIKSAQAFAETFRRDFPGARATLILGVLADKDWERMAEILAPLATRVLLVPVQSARSLPPHQLAEACHRGNANAVVETRESLQTALERSTGDSLVVITGSLYLVGEAMELLKVSPTPVGDERGLNEWTAASRR